MLHIHSVIVELIHSVAPIATAIGRHDSALEKQLRAALSSAALNVSEGSDQKGKRGALHYSIALGSARESWSALVVAAAWGYVAPPDASLKGQFDHVIGTLHRVVHPRR